jgi:hypothetical protein
MKTVSSLFDSILYTYADPNGRSPWLAGTYNNRSKLFVSVYAPNFGSNKEYCISLFKEIELLANASLHKIGCDHVLRSHSVEPSWLKNFVTIIQ